MVAPFDSRFAFLRDPDLYDLIYRLALRWTRSEADADDLRHESYVVAMDLTIKGEGPSDDKGHQRGWMCSVFKNHARRQRKDNKKNIEEPRDPGGDFPELAVDDERTVAENVERVERIREAAENATIEHPEDVERILAPDGRAKKDGTAKGAAERKRRERSKAFLAARITAAAVVGGVLVFIFAPPKVGPPVVIHDKPEWNDATLATAARELAFKRCAASDWEACLHDLDEARRLDPAGDADPRVQAAWQEGVQTVRADGLKACGRQDWMRCIRDLDVAARYDPKGDEQAVVKLARSEAAHEVQITPTAPGLLEAKPQ
jgi:hypothetical protein